VKARGRLGQAGSLLATLVGLAGCDLTDPSPATDATEWRAITVGDAHVCVLDIEGRAACWGANSRGQAGRDGPDSIETPSWIDTDRRFATIDAGARHTCGVTVEGEIVCWGSNDSGQLGAGIGRDRSDPQHVDLGMPAVGVSAGTAHSCAVRIDRRAYCWGSDQQGRGGSGGAAEEPLPPLPVLGDRSFASVTAGHAHSCGVTMEGITYCWGTNFVGQLGNGSLVPSPRPTVTTRPIRFRNLEAGAEHSCGVDALGAAWCWGGNRFGEVSYSESQVVGGAVLRTEETVSYVGVGDGWTCSLATSGEVSCYGLRWDELDGDSPGLSQEPWNPSLSELTNARLLAVGARSACAVGEGTVVRCWGYHPPRSS